MSRFSKLHPLAAIIYFALIIVLSCASQNPFFAIISFFGAVAALLYYGKLKEIKTVVCFALPMIILIGVFNMLFAHWGITVLFQIKDTQFTLESLLYGLYQGLVFSCVTLWLMVYGKIISSEKFTSVFGKIFPGSALLFSMSIQSISMFKKESEEIALARNGLGIEEKTKFKESVQRFSALVTNAFEGSITKADSMKARGYGKKMRKTFSRYSFALPDFFAIFITILLALCFIYIKLTGHYDFIFDPQVEIVSANPVGTVVAVLLAFFPFVTEIEEDIRWHLLKSVI